MIYKNIAELAGNTPLLELGAFAAAHGAKARVLAKLECRNPAGSVKDRVALSMILDAEARGTLRPGGVIIEPTSGNTGIGLAAMCAARGYRLVIVMPDSMSAERRKLIAAYGAELVLTPGAEGMAGAIKKAEEIAAATPGSMIAGQFTNPANPDAHFRTTGPEIWRDTDGKISAFVAGAGTGGTVTGVGRYLKGRDKNIKIYAAEPAESAVISGKDKGAHGIQLDGVLTVTTADAKAAARELARTDGVLAGISGGCNVCAAVRLAAADEFVGGTIVTVLPDAGDRYLSTDLY